MGEVNFLSNWVVVESVPESYVFPLEKRPGIAMKKPIPVVDFAIPDRAFLVRKILDISQEFGFFQMINHGVPKMLLEETMRIFREFHGMSTPDKLRECSRDPNKSCKVYTSSAGYMTEQIHNWKDSILFNCYPLEKYVHFWPQNPPKYRKRNIFETLCGLGSSTIKSNGYLQLIGLNVPIIKKEVVGAYCDAMRMLTMEIIEVISVGLGVSREYLEDEMTENTRVVVNHYPPCPNPSLTLGLIKHCDPTLITILFQDVSGLQYLKDGEWLVVDPIDGALLVNIGYVFQVISNGKLKAGEHRVVTNAETSRQSLVYLVYPKDDATIEPAKCMINEVDRPRYRSFKYEDFERDYLSMNADSEAVSGILAPITSFKGN